jgi:uncharacterized membrane protein
MALYATNVRYGRRITELLLLGAILYTVIIENFIVLNGGYDYYGYANSSSHFLGYLIWLGVVPLWIILGWFIMTSTSYILTDTLLPRASPYLRALLAALISLNIDLLLDPVAVSTGLWRWTHPSVYFLGVPLTNLIGWPLIVYFFVLAFDTTVMRKVAMGQGLSMPRLEWRPILKSFLTRLLIMAPIVIVGTLLVLILLIPYSNVSGPFNNVFPAPAKWWS